MTRLLPTSAVVVLTILVSPSVRAADDIRILQGTLIQGLNQSQGSFDVRGTSGLSMKATLNSAYASLRWDLCERPLCAPGAVISIRAVYGARFLAGSGDVKLRGETYRVWQSDAANAPVTAHAVLEFDGEVVVPELTEGTLTQVNAPFSFSGILEVPNRDEPGTFDVLALRGSGVATVTFARHPFSPTHVVVLAVRYDFSPEGNLTTR